MNLTPLPHPTRQNSTREKETKLVFFTTDLEAKLLTLGKGPSWRLYIVTQHQAIKGYTQKLQYTESRQGPPSTLERILLESPKSHASNLSELLEYPRYFQHTKTEKQKCNTPPPTPLFYTHIRGDKQILGGGRGNFPVTAPFGWFRSPLSLYGEAQKPPEESKPPVPT